MYYEEQDELFHYGMPRRSGRYPWGSGKNPYQHSGDFYARVEQLRKEGKSEKEIATYFDLSVVDLRTAVGIAKRERIQTRVDSCVSMKEDGLSNVEIGKKLGIGESLVRKYLNMAESGVPLNMAQTTADILRDELEKKGMIDVGAGVEKELGVSEQTLKQAIALLEMEGNNVYSVGQPQVTNRSQQTIMQVLTTPDVTYGDAYKNRESIQPVKDYYSEDGGITFKKLQYPESIDSNRIAICYGDEGGSDKDGVIEIRRGVDDLDLGNSHYAQVRILVDGTHYLKGMAMYSDDLPDGVDIRFNTNKTSDTAKMDVLKAIKNDPDNPFGADLSAEGQSYYTDKDGNQRLSAINKIKEEGDWDKMSRTISSQFLSKQSPALINRQLDLTYADYVSQLDDINSYNNNTIKKKMLLDFADECESAAQHLKAAAFPRQSTQVILPLTEISDSEVYAPNYKTGEQVVLIRYPHGGTFEIPKLTVNNNNVQGKKVLGNTTDAIGINSTVAKKLSGADFDGDQVVVIPVNRNVNIKASDSIKELEDFDPKVKYAEREGMSYMTKANTQKQMGSVSNLITDMTLKNASLDEITKAVKHSMVVIDAEKHKLDYKKSEKDNDIALLKKKYQTHTNPLTGKEESGASTLLSMRKKTIDVDERKGSPKIEEDGSLTYKTSGRTYVDKKTGKTVKATQKESLLKEVDDLNILSSGSDAEKAYAKYGNSMKELAKEARRIYLNTPNAKYDSQASKIYKPEVTSLKTKVSIAEKNAPRERQAQRIANSVVDAKKQANPDMDKKEVSKASNIAIRNARAQVGASGKSSRIQITDSEWEAIQAGAVSDSFCQKIFRYADSDEIIKRALPDTGIALSDAKQAKIRSMLASGYTNAEIADTLNISVSTVRKYAS